MSEPTPPDPAVATTPQDTVAVGRRLRAVRKDRRLSLKDVERLTDGRFKVGVLGSYERGDRNINIAQLLDLAEFYGVAASELLHGGDDASHGGRSSGPRLTVDMVALAADLTFAPVFRYLHTITEIRGRDLGRFESFRADDLNAMAATMGTSAAELRVALTDAGILIG